MILYYLTIAHVAQNTGNKTVCDFFQRCICLYMYVHIFYYFSIYWSDNSLAKKKKKKKKITKQTKKTPPAVQFLELIFRNNFFIFNFSKMCLR